VTACYGASTKWRKGRPADRRSVRGIPLWPWVKRTSASYNKCLADLVVPWGENSLNSEEIIKKVGKYTSLPLRHTLGHKRAVWAVHSRNSWSRAEIQRKYGGPTLQPKLVATQQLPDTTTWFDQLDSHFRVLYTFRPYKPNKRGVSCLGLTLQLPIQHANLPGYIHFFSNRLACESVLKSSGQHSAMATIHSGGRHFISPVTHQDCQTPTAICQREAVGLHIFKFAFDFRAIDREEFGSPQIETAVPNECRPPGE
jgi:hypothetical protein